jgi:hypothetical protein
MITVVTMNVSREIVRIVSWMGMWFGRLVGGEQLGMVRDGQADQPRDEEQLVGDRVEEGAERGRLPQVAGDEAVEGVRDGRPEEQEEGHPGLVGEDADDEERNRNEPQERQLVGEREVPQDLLVHRHSGILYPGAARDVNRGAISVKTDALTGPGSVPRFALVDIDELLRLLVEREASDLHLKPMRPPMLRIRGRLVESEGAPLAPAVLRDSLHRMLNDRQRAQLEEHLYVDFGYSLVGVSRFRGSVYLQRGTHAACSAGSPSPSRPSSSGASPKSSASSRR